MLDSRKTKILMLTPLILGLGFFVFSILYALNRFENTKVPEKDVDVSMNISNYEIQQIDDQTNKVKWILKADEAETSVDESQAEILNCTLFFFEEGEPKFTIKSSHAYLDKANQEVILDKNVELIASDESYKITAGRMFFSEEKEFIRFSENWEIENQEGYVIDGETGMLKKDLAVIISQKNAILKKDGFILKADEIILEPEIERVIQALGNASLELTADDEMKAQEIIVYKNGKVEASKEVNVETSKINCFSEKLDIFPGPDKKPAKAEFTGKPYILQGANSIYADKIHYDFATEIANFEGHVHSGALVQ